MEHNWVNAYGADSHIAEIYDQYETQLDDVELIRKLIKDLGFLKILEPFCGTGRMLIPLASDGHQIHGLDQSEGMLLRARQKIRQLPLETQQRIQLTQTDALVNDWPQGFDLVLLGCNCFYELATPEEQETCIRLTSRSLHQGGHVWIDNDHMEGELAASWQQDLGVVKPSLRGTCADGTVVESNRETIWFDVPNRLARFRRSTKITRPDGTMLEQEYIQQKHPVSRMEIQAWLEQNGFIIEGIFGDYSASLYSDSSPRAIFWARRN